MLELSQRRWALCRFDQFVLGLGAAVAHARLAGRLRAPRAAGWGLVVGAGLLLAAAVPLDALTWPRPGGHAAYALVSLAMTALVAGGALLTARVRVLEPLRALGVVSYGFFLYHQLAIAQLQRWVPGAACWSELAVTGLGALALASLAGAASWHLVESPSLKLVSGWLKGRGLRATTRTPACVEDIAAGGRGV
jgi:peptidoglycan/LPS O-acetylase OafA/YrhL